MSGSASLDLERQMLSHTLAIAPMPTLARVYVALCDTTPTEAAGGSELAGGGYARTAATFALMATPANAAANATAVDFAPATGNWATITHFELWTQPTGGTRLYWGQLVDPADGVPLEIDVTSGDAVRFSPGSLVVQAAEVATVGGGPWLPLAGGEMVGPLDHTATGGTIPRSAQDRAAETVNVLDYGAAGDGATNDTAAIQAAIAYAAANARAVYLPTGVYRITQLTYPAGLRAIIGADQFGTTLKRIDSDPAAASYAIQNGTTLIDGLRICDLTIDGNKANNANPGAGILLTNCSRIHIENVTVRDINSAGGMGGSYGWGIYIKTNNDGANGTRSVLRNVSSIACDGPGLNFVLAASNIDVEGGLYADNGSTGIANDANGSVAGAFSRIAIRGCLVRGNLRSGIGLGGIRAGFNIDLAQDCTITGNTVTNNGIYGISWQGLGGVITNNIVRNNGNYTPSPYAGMLLNAVRSNVSDNVIAYNRIWGIDAGGAQYCTISNNLIERNYNDNGAGGSGTGINLGAGIGNLIAGNHFLENGEAPGNNGGSQLAMKPYDGGGAYPMFPLNGRENSVLNNLVTVSSLSTAFGLVVSVNGKGTVIQGNTLKGFTTTWRSIYATSQAVLIRDNRSLDALAGESIAAGATLVIPDCADTFLLTGTGTSISSIISRPMYDYTGELVAINADTPGSGYSSPPAVAVTGAGTGATATAYLDGAGGVAGYAITNGGSGYTTATIGLSGGGGTGATATAQVGVPNALDGRRITLVNSSGNSQTLVNGAVILLAGSANAVLTNGSVITLVGSGGVLREVSRSIR